MRLDPVSYTGNVSALTQVRAWSIVGTLLRQELYRTFPN